MIEDMQVRNLGVGTQQVYVQQVSLFAQHFHKSPELLRPEQIRTYQIYLTNEKKLTTNSIYCGDVGPPFPVQDHPQKECGVVHARRHERNTQEPMSLGDGA
jgi:hypothetical protein